MSGVRYDSQITTIATTTPPGAMVPVLAIPGAIVEVFSGASPASLYQDQALTVAAANPLTCDETGAFGFYAASGSYTYTVSTPAGTLVGTFNLTLPVGATGPAGPPNTLALNVTTLAPGTSPTATISGTAPSQALNLGLSTGAPGAAGSVTVGTTTTGAPGTSASVTNSGTSSAAVLQFTVPTGPQGATGLTGPALAVTGVYAAGTTYTLGQAASYSGALYVSLQNANTGNTPSSSPSWWSQVAATNGLSALSVVTASGSANFTPAAINDVVLTSLVSPYYVNVNASGDGAGRTRKVINIGSTFAGVYAPGTTLQFLAPGDCITYTYNGTTWTPDTNYNVYAQANALSYTVPLGIESVAYSWTAAGSIRLPANNVTTTAPITIYNYGTYPVTVYNGNGTTVLLVLAASTAATFGNIGAGVWYAASQSSFVSTPNKGLRIVTAPAGANYSAAVADDVILSSLVAPYYVAVSNGADTAGTRRTVINTGTTYAGVVAGGGPQFVPPGEAITWYYDGTNWTADNDYTYDYAQVNTATYAAPLSLTFLLYAYGGIGSVTLNGSASSEQAPLDIYNYGSYALNVYQSNGTTLLATVAAGTLTTFRCFTAGIWIVVSSSSSVAPFGASGSSHAPGLVPDPGSLSGTTRYLREDATWVTPPSSGGGGGGGVTLPSPITDYTSLGDSITVSVGATQVARGYAYRLAAYFGGIFNNLGYGGDESPDMSWKAVANYDPLGLCPLPFVTVFIGHNDINYVGNTANGLAKYGSALMAALTHMAVPQDCKVFGQNATLTGTFAANTALSGYIGGMAVTGTANGDTVTLTIVTTAANQPLYISWYGKDSDGGAASFTLDGSVIDTVTTQGPGGPIATVNGGTTAAWAKRYVVASAGSHTLVVKITSATAAGNSFTFLWAGTSSGTSATPARVLAMDPVYEAGLASKSTTDAYIAVLTPIATQLASDGLPVLHFATNAFVNNTLGMSTTATSAPDGTFIAASTTPGLHPNDYGHAQIAAGVASVAAPSTIPSQRTFARTLREFQGSGTATIANGDEVCIINGLSSVSLPVVGFQREEHWLWNYGTTNVSVTGYGGPWTLYPGQAMLFVNINGGFMQMFGVGTTNSTLTTLPSLSLPGSQVSTATTSALGVVKPDGTTITISGGVISAASGGGGASTPATTSLLKGNGAANSVVAATAGTDYVVPSGSITGTAGNVTATSNATLATLSALSLPSGQVTGLGTMATQAASAVAITGGTIDGTVIGSTTPAAGTFSSVTGNVHIVDSGAGAASSAALSLVGAPYTGGTGTTTYPLLYCNTTGSTQPTTLSTAGTFFGVNAPSGFGGSFLDFRVNGASPAFTVTSSGAITASSVTAANLATGTTSQNLYLPGSTTPSAASTSSYFLFGGSTAVAMRAALQGTATATLSANSSYSTFIVGLALFTTASSGTHPWLTQCAINGFGTITSGGAAVSNTANLYVAASNTTLGASNYAAYVAGNSGLNGVSQATSTKTAAYTAVSTDYTLRGNAAGGAFTITLPLLPIAGQLLVIKKIDSSANAVTINANGGTIDGASTQALSTQYQVLRLQCAVASSGASTWDIV